MPPRLHPLHPKSLTFLNAAPISSPACRTTLPVASNHIQRLDSRTSGNRPNDHGRSFSSLNRPPSLYPGHVPITLPERLFLALGSTIWSAISPRRADLIALCSETTTPISLLRNLRDRMLISTSGREILRERPRISTRTVDVEKLRNLPAGTVGHIYANWLQTENVTPDTRDPVKHVPEEELAYVLQRYRESHDLYHVLLAEKGMPSFLEGEVVVKGFEFAALGLPMTGMAAMSALKLKGSQRRRVLWGGKGGAGDTSALVEDGEVDSEILKAGKAGAGEGWLWWAVRQGMNTRESDIGCLLNIYWEKEWETPIARLRRRLGIELPAGVGDLREIRKRAKELKKKAQEAGRG